MTPEEKIAALVEHIKKEFPDGCSGVLCSDCPVNKKEYDTVEYSVCELLEWIRAYSECNASISE